VQHLPTVRASQSWKTSSCEKELEVLTGMEEKLKHFTPCMSKKAWGKGGKRGRNHLD